jgi:predicted ATP-grasp superfamily ATP-dependent carboligase
VVVAVDSVGALAAVRSLGRVGARVIAVHHAKKAIGFRSRFAEPWLCPHPREDEEGFVESLLALGEKLVQRAPIFPVADPHLDAIARNYRALSSRYLLPFSNGQKLQRLRDKRFQAECAAAAGLAVPRTVDRPAADLAYPVVVKSSDSARFVETFGAKGLLCASGEELEEVFERAKPLAPIIQEWIPGPDDQLYLVGAYLAAGGESLGVVTARKLKQFPPEIGTIRAGEASPIAELADLALAFLRAAECYGPSDVEFKLDARDGRFKFIEANPRLVQWQGLAAAAGVDLASIAYRDLTGAKPSPACQTPASKRWAITFLTGSGHERPGYSGSGPVLPRLPYTDAVFAVDDPWPAVAQFGEIAKGLFGRVRQR